MASIYGIKCQVKGLDALLNRIEDYAEAVGSACADAVELVADLMIEQAQALAPVDTGELQGSIDATNAMGLGKYSGASAGGGAMAVVVAAAEHAPYVEYGTGPQGAGNHAGINPAARGLAWRLDPWVYPAADGTFVKTYGQPARPFFYPAQQMAGAEMASVVASALASATEGV